MAARVPENVSEFASPYDLKQVSTDQKVGSSNLPGRAIFFNELMESSAFPNALFFVWGHNRGHEMGAQTGCSG